MDASESSASAEALDLLERHGLRNRCYVLFAAARVDPTKGCHTLLEACRLMQPPPAVLVIGDLCHAPGYEARLRELANGLPVTFLPRLDEKAVLMGLLQHCRVFVFPSTVEGMSMILLEALAVGTVGIASDIPENASILPEGYPTFTAGDSAALCRQFEGVLEWDDAQREAFIERSREWVRTRYDWSGIATQYEQVYRDAVEKWDRSGWRRLRRRSRRVTALPSTEVRRRSQGQHREA